MRAQELVNEVEAPVEAIEELFGPFESVEPVEEEVAQIVQPRTDADAKSNGIEIAAEPVIVPWDEGRMSGWVELRTVRDRQRKAAKMSQAVSILESIGEDDIALELMNRTNFTPLEKEVVSLLEYLGELP